MVDAHLSDTTDTYVDDSIASATSLVTRDRSRKLTESSVGRADLDAALEDLEGVIDEAREDGYPDPTPKAIENARLLVKSLYDIRPMRYDIYPMDDGEIVIDGGEKRRLGVFCYPDGSVLYIGWADGERVRMRRDAPEDVPCEFLKLALNQLGDA